MPRRPVIAFIALLILCCVPGYAQEPRVAPANDAFNSRIFVPRNSGGTLADIDSAAVHEANEPLASCAHDGNDVRSVWFKMTLPVGKLKFTAVGTGYVPVITIFRSEGPMTNLGSEIGCATNPVLTSPSTTILNVNITVASPYIIRVAEDDSLVLGEHALDYAVEFTPPSGKSIPANDSQENATQIVFNKIAKSNNVEYSTFDATDPEQTCTNDPMYHSVWYTFAIELDNTDVTLLTEGSLYNEGQNTFNPARIALFEDVGGVLTSRGCSQTGGVSGAGRIAIQLDPGTYYVALFSLLPNGLDGTSTARLQVIVEELHILKNGSFDGGLSPWKLKKPSGDGIVSTPTGFDDSSVQFVASPGEASKLTQTVNVDGFVIPADSLLSFGVSYKTFVVVDPLPTFELKITYSDGSTQTFKDKLDLGTNTTPGSVAGVHNVVTKKGAVKLTVSIKNKMTVGDYVVDGLGLRVRPFGIGLRDSVLPLPPAAQ